MESGDSLVTPGSLPGHKEGALCSLAPVTVKADRLIYEPQADLTVSSINIQFLLRRECLYYLDQLAITLEPTTALNAALESLRCQGLRGARPWRVSALGITVSNLTTIMDVRVAYPLHTQNSNCVRRVTARGGEMVR
jgi:hypothetical protein